MSRKTEHHFSVWRELWYPFLAMFILSVFTFGGYYLFGKDPLSEEEVKNQQELTAPALSFMQKLKVGSLNEAYEQVSADFKEAMPLDRFLSFIGNYPVLTQFDKIVPSTPVLEGETVVIPLLIEKKGVILPLHITLTKEKGEWKVLGFVLNQPSSNQELRDLTAVHQLSKVVHNFLTLIKEGKTEEAYQAYTSISFQQETPLKDFLLFIQKQPAFHGEHEALAADGYIDNNRGGVKFFLENKEKNIPIDFSLIQENDVWKIEGLYLPPPSLKGIKSLREKD